MVLVGHFHRLGVEVFVGHAPGVLEVDLGLGHAALVDDAVAVAAEESVHVVEIAAPAIDEDGVVTLGHELLAEAGIAALAPDALDDGAARRGRHRQGNRLQAAVGAGAGGIEVVEIEAFAAQGVEVGSESARIAVAAEELGAEALHCHENDVSPQLWAAVDDASARVEEILAEEGRVGLGERLAQDRPRLGFRQGGVEAAIVDLVVAKGREELVRPVAGELAPIGVLFLPHGEILVDETRIEGGEHDQPGEGGKARLERQGRGLQRAGDHPAQGEGQREREHGKPRDQRPHGVGLADVVDHFRGVDEVIDGDEVEPRAEFVPEEVFGRGHEEHGKEARGRERIEEGAVRPRGPQSVRTQHEEVEGERQGRVDQEGEVVGQTDAVDAQHIERRTHRLARMQQKQGRAGEEEDEQPGKEDEREKTGLSVTGKRHEASCPARELGPECRKRAVKGASRRGEGNVKERPAGKENGSASLR